MKLTIDDVRVLAERLCKKHNLQLTEVVECGANEGEQFEVRIRTTQNDFFGSAALDPDDLENKERAMHYIEQLCESVRRGAKRQDRIKRGKFKFDLSRRDGELWWYHVDSVSLLLCDIGDRVDGREIQAIDSRRHMIALPPLMQVVAAADGP